jgi:hypothetical protein
LDHDEEEVPPLNSDEIKAFRELLINEQRWHWLWSTLRIWVSWATAASLFFYATYEFIIKQISGGK